MKISTASKKVLASALSAAMVVAFAPTVAFGAELTEADYIAAGATVKVAGSASVTDGQISLGSVGSYTYFTSLEKALAALNAAGSPANSTIVLLGDQTATATLSFANTKANTLDLNGHSITGAADVDVITVGTAAGDALTVKGTGSITAVKTGDNSLPKAINSTSSSLTIQGGTYTGEVVGEIDSVTGATMGKVTDKDAGMTVKNATFESIVGTANSDTITVQGNVTVAASSDKTGVTAITGTPTLSTGAVLNVSAESTADTDSAADPAVDGSVVAINGALTYSGVASATVTAKAAGKDASAKAIHGNITGLSGKSSLVVSAETTGVQTSTSGNACGAVAIAGGNDFTVGSGVTGEGSISASVADADAAAVAVMSNDFEVYSGSYIAKAAGKNKATAVSVAAVPSDQPSIAVKGGAFAGALSGATPVISAGTFTDFEVTKNMLDTGAVMADDGTTVTVFTAGSISAGTTKVAKYDETNDVLDGGALQTQAQAAAADIVDAILNDEAASGVAFADGVTAATVKQILQAGRGLKVNVAVTAYNEKTATAEDAATLKAANEFAAKNACGEVKTFYKVAITLAGKVNADDKTETTLATITDMGKSARTARSVELNLGVTSTTKDSQSIVSIADGVVTPCEYTKDAVTTKVYGSNTFAVVGLSLASIKDAIENQEPVAPVEKATQSIDVAQKSKTVKLAGAKKTKKAVTFKLGASAETELTIAKKSGSSHITVSGQKVTLKKGTKKGTFTAKVSLKAAGSDEYLAAAKTITVKFVVKK